MKLLNKIKNHKCKHKKIIKIVLIILFIYLLLVGFAKTIQTIATFPAIFVNVQDVVWHVKANIDFEEINIDDGNWNNINWLYMFAWTWAKTVYYFHGNGWPLSYFYNEIKYINWLWYNVMAYDYPWYWKSEWFPYKKNVDNFSEIFYKKIKEEKNIKDDELIIRWYSVWTAVATDFASKHIFDKLILVSPFASRYEMVEKRFWFNLAKYLFLNNSYNTKELVKKINRPVLIIHWNNDKIVPFNQWKEVFNASISKDKYFIELDNFGHNYIINTYSNALKWIINNFLNWEELDFNNNYLFIDQSEKNILEQKNKKDEFIKNLDLETDSSITKFVNSKISFNDKWYIPENLVSISSEHIFDAKWWTQKLRKIAKENLDKLAKDFEEKFNRKLKIVSAYRSYAYQKWIKDRWCPDNLCAKAGYSEHQTWLTVDIFEASSELNWKKSPVLQNFYKWFDENAYKYWFHNTYQKWLEIDWYEIEPWHWRYMWVEFATYLKDNDMTIAEFYFNKEK